MKDIEGTYRILETIATGGTAVLYKAIQTSLDRPVVIKRLHAHLISDPDFTRRFQLEAKAAARLDHGNIVRIIDFGASGDDHYIVMEYIDGPSLKEVLAGERVLGDDLTLLVAREICLGLDHAHRRGIVHRDIKPANIMIGRDGRVVITDFGLAKLQLPDRQETVASTLLGTPLYMSPEQAVGETIDGRSDLFSLGTICYEALTGTRPFRGDTYAAVIHSIVNGAPMEPRRRAASVRPETEAIVMKALARDPSKRFRDAAEMANAVESALSPDALSSARDRLRLLAERRESSPRRSASAKRKPPRRSAAALAAAAAAAALLVFAILRSGGVDGFSRSIRAGFAEPVSPQGTTMLAGMEEPLAGVIVTPIEEPVRPAGALPAEAETLRQPPDSSASPAGVPVTPPADTAAVEKTSPNAPVPPPAAPPAETDPNPAPAPDTIAPAAPAAPTRTPAAPPARSARAVEMGFLDVAVEPPASIVVDGEPRTASGRLAMLELEAGSHEIVCRREGYREYRETVWITSGELSRRRIALQEITGSLHVDSERGAQLYVDGAYRGTLPLSQPVSLSPGAHRVQIKKAGYRPWSTEVYVPPDEPLSLSIRLVPESQGQ